MGHQYNSDWKIRLWIASGAGLVSAIVTYLVQVRYYNSKAADLTWVLVAARQWLSGQNPYTTLADPSIYPYDPAPLFYPFPAVLLVLPLSFLPDIFAAVIWVGISVGLMTYALSESGLWRLPILASLPLWAAVAQVQWTPLLVCLWVWPVLLPLALLKPTSGLALSSKQITKKGGIGVVIFGLISLLLLPGWPLSWLEISRQSRHLIPVLYGPGPLLILAALRWRTPEARLLLLMACMPQRAYFYDQLPVLLVAKTLRQQLVIVLMSWAALFATIITGPTWHWPAIWHPESVDGPAGWVIVLIYGTALGLVLRQKENALES